MSSLSLVLYVGFTYDLKGRVWQHKQDIVEGFTKKYKCHSLVYFEAGDDKFSVLAREKQIKKYRRGKKIQLIDGMNAPWNDLYTSL